MKPQVALGRWGVRGLEQLLKQGSAIRNTGERIAYLSEQLLGTSYRESTLIGDCTTDEVFVINLEGVDCFTYLDYVEAMRLSSAFAEFRERLRHVRYRNGEVGFRARNHFFTDWAFFNCVDDATHAVGDNIRIVRKRLNENEDGELLPGLGVIERTVAFIPANAFDRTIGRLRTGDYIGIYTDTPGLDVSHVGILVRKEESLCLRHASSHPAHRMVVDVDFRTYLEEKEGIVVLRPLEP